MENSQVQAPRGMRTFLIIWIGQVISIVGSGLTSFALGVWIFQKTGQATPFTIVLLLSSLPRILLAPLAGSLADRYNRRWLMILSDTFNAVVTLSAVLMLLFADLQIWMVYIVAVFSSICSVIQEPAYAASISMMVPKKDLGRANGLIQLGYSMESLVAPLLAGFLFVAIGLKGVILIDFITYFFAVGALLIVRIPQPARRTETAEEKSSIWKDALFGWNYLRSRPGLFGLLLYYAQVNFLLNFSAALLAPLVLSYGTASTLGVVETAMGVGMLLGSLLMSTWGGPKRRIYAVFGFIALAGVGMALAGLRPSPWFTGAGLFILMFAIPLGSGPSSAIFQTKVAHDVQGRVFAIRGMISQSMMPLAFLIAGPLADYVFNPAMLPGGALSTSFLVPLLGGTGPGRGIGLMALLSGVVLLISSALTFANPRIRNVEEELPDAVLEPVATVEA